MPKLLYLTTQDKFFLSHIKDRALYAKKCGFSVSVAAQKTDEIYAKQIRELGFAFYDTAIERQSINPISQVKALVRIVKIFRSVNPDISHHLGAKSIIFGTLAKRFAHLNKEVALVNAPIGLGYVYAARDVRAQILRPIVSLLYRLTLNPKNSHVIVENPDDLDYFVKMGAVARNQGTCIYGAGVDTKLFSPSKEKNKICTVVMASRLIQEKGVFEFYQAAKILRSRGLPVRMQLVGEPDYGNPHTLTEEQFARMNQCDAIECLGYRNNIEDILKKAHICCLPSFYREGLPRFLIEGTCCGLAIVTTDTVGCREAVANGNGYLISPKSVNDLTEAIAELVLRPKLCDEMGEKSRELALKYFDTEIICQQTVKIYCDLLSIKARE